MMLRSAKHFTASPVIPFRKEEFIYDFSYFLFTTVLQKNNLSENEINRKQQLKQLTDKITDIKSSYYTQMY